MRSQSGCRILLGITVLGSLGWVLTDEQKVAWQESGGRAFYLVEVRLERGCLVQGTMRGSLAWSQRRLPGRRGMSGESRREDWSWT